MDDGPGLGVRGPQELPRRIGIPCPWYRQVWHLLRYAPKALVLMAYWVIDGIFCPRRGALRAAKWRRERRKQRLAEYPQREMQ